MATSTKQDIVLTLAQCLRERRLDEITVKDLTERCGISRQAFYYHFSDLYDVVKWGIAWELEQLSGQVKQDESSGRTRDDWEYLLELVEDRMMPNRVVVLNVYRSIERSYVQYHLMESIRPVFALEVEKLSGTRPVTEAQKQFVTELITTGIVSICLGWLDSGMPSRHMDQMEDFRVVMDGCVENILLRLGEKNQEEK